VVGLVTTEMMKRFTRKEFLDALFGQYFERQDGFIMVKTMKHLDRRISTRYFPNVEILSKESYHQDQEVFFGVCPRETMKPDTTHIRFISALWAGLDLGPDGYSGNKTFFRGPAPAAKAVRSFPLPPSIVIESGWGMHLYWLLKDVWRIVDREQLEGLLEKISNYFQCDNQVGLDATLRLPGTFNCKIPGKSVPCDIKYLNTDFRYDLGDFDKLRLGTDIVQDQRNQTRSQETLTTEEDQALNGPRAYEVEEEHEDFSQELKQYMQTEPAKTKELFHGTANQDLHMNATDPAQQVSEPEDDDSSDIEPLLYESTSDHVENAKGLPSDDYAETLVDRIADRVVERLSEDLMDDLVDQIVEKLVKRLAPH
jgi:hypothetical protein